MKCERDIEKLGITKCDGLFCQPDGFDTIRIAQNFPRAELLRRISDVERRVQEKPESCEEQLAFNQLSQALQVIGGLN